MNYKKIFTLLLIVVFSGFIIAGCGSNQNDPEKAGKKASNDLHEVQDMSTHMETKKK